jgi:hypothetical protein
MPPGEVPGRPGQTRHQAVVDDRRLGYLGRLRGHARESARLVLPAPDSGDARQVRDATREGSSRESRSTWTPATTAPSPRTPQRVRLRGGDQQEGFPSKPRAVGGQAHRLGRVHKATVLAIQQLCDGRSESTNTKTRRIGRGAAPNARSRSCEKLPQEG